MSAVCGFKPANYLILIKPKAEVFKYAKMAVETGNLNALYKYANMLLRGEGTDVNYEESVKYLKTKSWLYLLYRRVHSTRYD